MPRAKLNKETTALQTVEPPDSKAIMRLVVDGDCSKLTDEQLTAYYNYRCASIGLDPACTPFQLIKLQGKTVLYAVKACTDQLTAHHRLSVEISDQRTEFGIHKVRARVTGPDGRTTEDLGCVNITGLGGDQLCNALMKAVTKAKRRAVLSFCGLGMLDESELETIPGVMHASYQRQATLADRLPTIPEISGSGGEVQQYSQQYSPRNNGVSFATLRKFTQAKTALGNDAYYRILGNHGVQHANELQGELAAELCLAELAEQPRSVDYTKDIPPLCPKCGGVTRFVRAGKSKTARWNDGWGCNSPSTENGVTKKNCKERGVKGAWVDAKEHHAREALCQAEAVKAALKQLVKEPEPAADREPGDDSFTLA